MPRPANVFRRLAGVPVHYDRFTDPLFGYGTRGRPYRFHSLESFERKLRACFKELWAAVGDSHGEGEVITSAGAYVDKPGSHGLGRGFDLDGIFWSSRSFITANYPQDRQFYVGVEALLRKHFGTVLNYEYDAAHRDHFHIDDSSPKGFSANRRSVALFVQMALTHVYDIPVLIDGAIGPQTNEAVRDMLVKLSLATQDEVASDTDVHRTLSEVWVTVLDNIAEAGFAATSPARKNPLELLQDVYASIGHELAGDERRKRVETALTTFASHQETYEFLDAYR